MEDIKRILVVSKSTKFCQRAVHYGVSLARKFGAQLDVLHVVHNPFGLEGWALPIPSLKVLEEEYDRILADARSDLDKMVASENAKGMDVNVWIREGDPTREIFKVVEDEKIDLLIMLGHEEGRLEHLLFGRSNDEIVRKMPCSIMLVKQEPGPSAD